MRKRILLFCGLLACLPSPATLAGDGRQAPDARVDNTTCQRLPTAPGPHSLLLVPGSKRLLISSHDRRQFEKPGEIDDYDITTGKLRRLPRSGEPADLVLRPHGFDLASRNGELLLYLISHDEDTPNGKAHSILVYAVEADRLVFRQRLRDPLLSSPNHISVAPDGDLYVSNDRRDGSSVMELALRSSKANIVHYREGRGWEIVADKLSFPNGVKADASRLLVPLSFGNALLSYPRRSDGSLGPRRDIVKLPALDGLNPGPDPDSWLVVSHGPLLDFLRHKSDAKHPSSAILYLINASTGKYSPFFADDGRRISAMSNAIIAGNALYIGQSFDSFLLRCPLK
jgi:hypothetical protein